MILYMILFLFAALVKSMHKPTDCFMFIGRGNFR